MQVGGQILPRYTALINAGISPQVAFDTSNLSLVEDNRKISITHSAKELLIYRIGLKMLQIH